MRDYIKNPSKHWTDAALRTAIAEQREAGTSIQKLSKKVRYS